MSWVAKVEAFQLNNHSVGNMRGLGDEIAARGMGKALYFFDLSKHLIEIRHYELQGD